MNFLSFLFFRIKFVKYQISIFQSFDYKEEIYYISEHRQPNIQQRKYDFARAI